MYKYYASKITDLENNGIAHVFKTNVTNLTDGGEIINVQILPNNSSVVIDHISGSLSSHPAISRKLTTFFGLINGSVGSPFIESTEEVFNAAYSQSLSHINNIQ